MRCPAHISDAFNGQCKTLPDAYAHPDQGTLRPRFPQFQEALCQDWESKVTLSHSDSAKLRIGAQPPIARMSKVESAAKSAGGG
jgi:hypothetical protein